MKRLLASSLVLVLAATGGLASAQTYGSASYHGQDGSTRYDYARVLRVDPVFDSRYGSKEEYKLTYRDGFEAGYAQGYGRRPRY